MVNLNQFFFKLVFWYQREKFYVLMKFEENLRWWVDHLGQLTENGPYIFLFAHISFVVNHRINATPPERLQQYQYRY